MSSAVADIVRDYFEKDAKSTDVIESLRAHSIQSSAFDGLCRKLVLDICEGQEDVVDRLRKLLELVLQCADAGLSGAESPLGLVEEALDVLTIGDCDQLFSFLETHRQRMTARMGKGQSLLRLCNELLRRLSKTKDTVFCGRILIFLSLVFPLSERSAVNLRGEYNIDNVTIFDQDGEDDLSKHKELADVTGDKMEIDEGHLTVGHELGGVSPDSLYTTFWSLQSYFNDPSQLIAAPLILSRFHTALGTVVQAFEKIEKAQGQHSRDLSANKSIDTEEIRSFFTPKMLTSKKLLALELADLTCRRHIMVQMLIVLDYLLGLSTINKEEWNKRSVTTNKSLQTTYVLPVVDAEWAAEMKSKIGRIMAIGDDGVQFYRTVEVLLARDQDWLRWKCSGCPPYDVEPIATARIVESPKKIVSLTAPKRPYPYTVGNAVLSRLWNSAGGWSDSELKNGSALPKLDVFNQSILSIEAELEDALIEEEIYALEDRKASQAWRALRIARLTDVEHFTGSVAGGKLGNYLEAISKDSDQQVALKTDVLDGELQSSKGPGAALKRSASDAGGALGEEKRQKLMQDAVPEDCERLATAGNVNVGPET